MLFPKSVVTDWEKDCWVKRCHGVAPRKSIRFFSGRLLKAEHFTGGVVSLNLRIFWNCDTLPICGAHLSRGKFSQFEHDYVG
jgi:hypothetical protein